MKEKFFKLIREQLTQGITPQKVAFTVALGAAVGIFPVLGSSTLLCLSLGAALKLNQPMLQAVNYLVSPLQIIMIPIFARIGEMIVGAKHFPFSIPEVVKSFSESPASFIAQFGILGLHAALAWTALAAPILCLAYFAALKLISSKPKLS